jgi:hypothetical protein
MGVLRRVVNEILHDSFVWKAVNQPSPEARVVVKDPGDLDPGGSRMGAERINDFARKAATSDDINFHRQNYEP